jgi:GTPase SAR1 family protein
MLRLWVAMAGQAGVGKSTLADSLAEDLRRRGHPVDGFGEEELFTRTKFVAVAEEFRTGSHPGPGSFEGAYSGWLSCLPEDGIGIMDWSPSGMAGDLPWGLAARSTYVHHLPAARARISAWSSDHVVSTEAEVEAAVEAGWPVARIDAARSSHEVLIQALAVVDGRLPR